MTEPGIEAGLPLSGSLEIPWFPGSAIRFFTWEPQQFTKHSPTPSKTTSRIAGQRRPRVKVQSLCLAVCSRLAT